MTQPQNDGTWQSSYGQPQDFAAQAAYQAQPAQPAAYGQPHPGQPAQSYGEPVQSFGQPPQSYGEPPAQPHGQLPPSYGQPVPQAAQSYGQPAPQAAQSYGQAVPQAAQSYGEAVPQAAPSYGQPVPQAGQPYGQPVAEDAYPQAYAEAPYQQAPPAPPYGGYNVPGYHGPAGGVMPPAPVGAAPGIGIIIVITALFGLFGAIPAAKRAGRAQALGLPVGRYWIAFGATLAVSWIAGIVLAFMMLSAAAAAVGETPAAVQSTTITADSVEQALLDKGDFRTSDGSTIDPTGATCSPKKVNDAGIGTWSCVIEFGTKTREKLQVTVPANGHWVISRGK